MPTASDFAAGRGDPLEIELNNQEMRAVGRLFAERKAFLIEVTGDKTQPDLARRGGMIEFLTILSVIRKLRCAMSRNRHS